LEDGAARSLTQESSIKSLRRKCNLLERELGSKEEFNASKLNDMNARASVMRESIKTMELECQAHKAKNLDLLNDKKQLQATAEECSKELETLRMEGSRTKHEVTNLQAAIKDLREAAEASARKEEIMHLALLEAAENSQTMSLELEASIQSFTDCNADCDQKQSKIEQLERAISTLETSQLKMKHSIDACWLHRLSHWLRKLIQSFQLKSLWAL
jgi:chromosome segregation ATPase